MGNHKFKVTALSSFPLFVCVCVWLCPSIVNLPQSTFLKFAVIFPLFSTFLHSGLQNNDDNEREQLPAISFNYTKLSVVNVLRIYLLAAVRSCYCTMILLAFLRIFFQCRSIKFSGELLSDKMRSATRVSFICCIFSIHNLVSMNCLIKIVFI